MKEKSIVMFGGSFNPPHNAHFLLAEQIINEYQNVEKVIFVPLNSLYHKVALVENEHRYQMLQLVCKNNSRFLVSRIEIDNPRPLYTIETLEKMQEQYPEHTIYFTIGTDNLRELSTWRRADELVKKFTALVLEREPDNIDEIIEKDIFLKKNRNHFIQVKDSIKSNLSSTFIRNQIKSGKSIQYLAPEEVCTYIEKNRLFL